MSSNKNSHTMKVVYVEPGKEARIIEIGKSLGDLQNAVGGYIEVSYPFEDRVGLVSNEEGKIMGMPLNRALYDDMGSVYDIIAGPFFICGLGVEDFKGLSDRLAQKYLKMFRHPESFVVGSRGIMVIK